MLFLYVYFFHFKILFKFQIFSLGWALSKAGSSIKQAGEEARVAYAGALPKAKAAPLD